MLRKFIPLAAFVLGAFLQVSPAPLRALALGAAGLEPAALPAGLVPRGPSSQADLNRDGLPESLILSQGRLAIDSADSTAWESPSGWTVVQAQTADLNRDGTPEAVLLVWRPFRPWPVDQWLPHGGRIAGFQDRLGNSCQIILVGWRNGRYMELWAGSALAEPVRSLAAVDLDDDNLQELVTLEGRYSDSPLSPARWLKVWEWNGFGFSIVSGLAGMFDKMALVQAGHGRSLILVP